MSSVAIIDYGSGNLRSAAKAFERAAREAGLEMSILVTNNADAVANADRIVLPGVGAYADCRAGLDAVPGMTNAMTRAVIDGGRPFMGICVGMQLMARMGHEHGDTEGLGWVAGDVVALEPSDTSFKIPHMGWNELSVTNTHPIFAGVADTEHAYFVHSYHFVADDSASVLATVDYGGAITAAIGRDNMVGTQFHPEKSQATGLKLITNFLKWAP